MVLEFGWLSIEYPDWLDTVLHELDRPMEQTDKMASEISIRISHLLDTHALLHGLSGNKELVYSHRCITRNNLASE